MRFLLVLAIVVGAIVLDHKKGPIFPSEVYCLAGAGMEFRQPASAHLSQSTTHGVRDWEYTPASSQCFHGTLWDGWSKKLGLAKETEMK
jgi:hypothetical protein